jgi:hypothetical protein
VGGLPILAKDRKENTEKDSFTDSGYPAITTGRHR